MPQGHFGERRPLLRDLVIEILGMIESCEVGEKEEIDPKTMLTIEFSARHKASFKSQYLSSKNR